jgi:hypothetical protein
MSRQTGLVRRTGSPLVLREDIRITMPPHPWCFEGLAAIRPLLEQG